jgi:fluoroquinolone transport system ATP-binding protein
MLPHDDMLSAGGGGKPGTGITHGGSRMIDVQGLTFSYAGSTRPAVAELSFRVDNAEIFGFLGPSGAGKSTTQKILIGLLRGYHGRVSVFGRDLSTWGSSYYERVGVSAEFPNSFLKLTAAENLAYFRRLYQGRTLDPQQLLDMVGLGDESNTPVSQFSKGMAIRLNVARSLLNDPELLFMDEPTSGLDPMNARRIKELIKAQRQAGKTVFLTTHNMAVAEELCDRVAFIVEGKITLIDSPRELKLRYGEASVEVEHRVNGTAQRQRFPLAGLGENASFLRRLQDGAVETIHTQEATLEDIFIRVTGRSLQ